MTTSEYAEMTGRHLAKIALCKFSSKWAKNIDTPDKGSISKKFAVSFVLVSKDAEGMKTINGLHVLEFWKAMPEADAKKILENRPYLLQKKMLLA